mgnify:FL=1
MPRKAPGRQPIRKERPRKAPQCQPIREEFPRNALGHEPIRKELPRKAPQVSTNQEGAPQKSTRARTNEEGGAQKKHLGINQSESCSPDTPPGGTQSGSETPRNTPSSLPPSARQPIKTGDPQGTEGHRSPGEAPPPSHPGSQWERGGRGGRAMGTHVDAGGGRAEFVARQPLPRIDARLHRLQRGEVRLPERHRGARLSAGTAATWGHGPIETP